MDKLWECKKIVKFYQTNNKMKKNVFLIFIFLYKTLIINAQLCCGCYEAFQIIEGKKEEKSSKKYCFDKSGVLVYGIMKINDGKDTTILIGSPFPNTNADSIEQEYRFYRPKTKKTKNELIIKFKRERDIGISRHIYKIKDNKILQIIEKEPPFSTKYTSYFYDNLQRLILIVEHFEGNNAVIYRQFIYEVDIPPSSGKYKAMTEHVFSGEQHQIIEFMSID